MASPDNRGFRNDNQGKLIFKVTLISIDTDDLLGLAMALVFLLISTSEVNAMVQKLKVRNSVSYGTGQYDSQSHQGKGKGQKLLPPAAGAGYDKATPNTGSAIVRDGVEGKGDKKRGYQTDAHSGAYHGKNGEAVGHKSDLHMQYDRPLYSEGREYAPEGKNPGHITTTSQNKAAKAAHHPPVSNVPHKFDRQPSRESHGFGYGSSQKSGHLRMSGHSNAHQVGKK